MGKNPFPPLTEWLETKAAKIAMLEEKARISLHEEQDQARYKQIMLEKANLLATLADEAAPLTSLLPQPARNMVEEGLARFSHSAMVAKRVGSVFYMSALLYPEDHRPGEKNDLEIFMDSVRQAAEPA